jgi:hypothetical protein
MKKLLLTVVLALASSMALADLQVGAYGGRLFANGNQSLDMVGASVGTGLGQFGLDKASVQATFDRSTTRVVNLNRWTATVAYDVVKLGPVQTNVRAGVAYLDPQGPGTSNGGAALVGFGLSLPVSTKFSLVADYAYQKGNDITKQYNGNIITAGAKYSF